MRGVGLPAGGTDVVRVLELLSALSYIGVQRQHAGREAGGCLCVRGAERSCFMGE